MDAVFQYLDHISSLYGWMIQGSYLLLFGSVWIGRHSSGLGLFAALACAPLASVSLIIAFGLLYVAAQVIGDINPTIEISVSAQTFVEDGSTGKLRFFVYSQLAAFVSAVLLFAVSTFLWVLGANNSAV